jgi:hypothetical protein
VHPEHDIRFFHRAKSGANISAIGKQIDAVLLEVGGRIDVLMISAGGNDVGREGFGALLTDAVYSLRTGVRPSQNAELNMPNPDYDPNPTIPNPNHDPNLTLPNPDYDPDMTIPNPDYDPAPTIPNPAFEPGIVIEENWVVRLEESLLIQGDKNGTAHPNLKGHEVYRDRLVVRP